jgi:hypothetical protein
VVRLKYRVFEEADPIIFDKLENYLIRYKKADWVASKLLEEVINKLDNISYIRKIVFRDKIERSSEKVNFVVDGRRYEIPNPYDSVSIYKYISVRHCLVNGYLRDYIVSMSRSSTGNSNSLNAKISVFGVPISNTLSGRTVNNGRITDKGLEKARRVYDTGFWDAGMHSICITGRKGYKPMSVFDRGVTVMIALLNDVEFVGDVFTLAAGLRGNPVLGELIGEKKASEFYSALKGAKR